MKSRALSVALAAAAFVLLEPAAVHADKFKPPYTDTRTGILKEDSTCSAATHSLSDICGSHIKRYYLVFNRAKGLKRFLDGYATVSGPIDTTSCELPLIDVMKIGPPPWKDVPPPPCE